MNKVTFLLLLVVLFCSKTFTRAQETERTLDSLTTARLSISGFCLCKTTLADLQQITNDFKEVEVEEMDTPKKCFGTDGRFTNGRGVYSEKFKGIIFQKGDYSEYVGKIRLTKDFRGKLPNGSHINLDTLKLRDVFVIYPELKETWGSRGCSEYWNFSDKTISFYVKIDKTIQPQFPINKTDYLDKPVEGIDLVTSCYGLLAPPSKPLQLFRPDEPMYYVDSIRTNESFIANAYQPSDFATMVVYRGEDAIKLGGQEAKNGLIYLYTKHYARQKYWMSFKSKSPAYAEAVRSSDAEGVVYILNKKVLKENVEAALFNVVEDNSLKIIVLDKGALRKKYAEKGKVGVILETKK